MSTKLVEKSGFTLVELLVAMAIFSFMLLIVVAGFLNIVRLHNEALASNATQDNARSAMDELVQAVRDSSGTNGLTLDVQSHSLCVSADSTTNQLYYVNAGILYRSDNCSSPLVNTIALTDSAVEVSNFGATLETGGPGITEQEVQMTLTVASNNGTANSTGTACNNNNSDRQFCSVITLTSGAVPR